MTTRRILAPVAALAAMLLAAPVTVAQAGADSGAVQFHLGVGSTVAAGFGRAEAVAWTAPRVRWQASERMAVQGGMMVAGSLMPQGYRLQGLPDRSLAPRREGTRLGGVWAAVQYDASERLRLWGSVLHIGGTLQPLWLDGAVPVGATVVSGGMAYELGEHSFVEMSFHLAQGYNAHMLLHPFGSPYCGPLSPELELFGGPWPY